MRGVFAGIIALFVLGLGTSIYLILSPEDYALMLLKGEKYSDAEMYYRNKYTHGDRSVSTLIPLKTLEIAKGENEKAIEKMEEYVQAHPFDVHARKLLGVLYLNGQKRDAYLANLQEIKKIDPSADILNELVDWHHARGEKVQEEEILNELISAGYAKEKDYFALAYLLASRQNYLEAFSLMQTKRELFPQTVNAEAVHFEIALLLEMGRHEEEKSLFDWKILQRAEQFFRSSNNPKEALSLIAELKSQRREDLAYQLIPPLRYLAKRDLTLQTELIELELAVGDHEKAFQDLMQLYGQQTLTGQLADLLARTALEKEYYLIVGDLIDHVDASQLSEGTYLELAASAIQTQDPTLARKAADRLGETYLERHPVTYTALELAQESPEAQERLRTLIQNYPLSISEGLTLMRLAATRKYQDIALDMGSKIFDFSKMSRDELLVWALIYIELDASQQALGILSKNKDAISKDKESYALALLNTSIGEVPSVEQWFETQIAPSKILLVNLYLQAEKAKAYPFALRIATRLQNRYPSKMHTYYYATALLNNGDWEQALPLFRELVQLVDAPYVKMGYLRALAEGGEGQSKEFNDFLSKFLASELSDTQLRDIGYLLLEKAHHYEKARALFWRLAHQTPPKLSDVETLLYLLGPRPDEEAISWIISQAAKAPNKDKVRWVKALMNIGQYEVASQILHSISTTAWTQVEYLLWIQILLLTDNKECLKIAVHQAFGYLEEAKDFELVAQLARGLGLLKLQRILYEHLVSLDCNNPLYWQNLARVAYELYDFTCALHYLHRYFSFGCFDKEYYASLFIYGEILVARNDPLLADEYYRAAMCSISAADCTTPAMEAMQATLYARLRYKWLGADMLRHLYEEDPFPDLRATVATIFMEMGRLRAAHYVLYNVCDAGRLREQTVIVQWKGPIEAKASVDLQEVLIETSSPISESNAQEVAEKLPPGILEFRAGFNTLLIKTATPAAFTVTAEKDLLSDTHYLRIHMVIYPKPFEPSLALGLAKANLALRERNFTYACALLAYLRGQYPDNVDVMSLISIAQEATGKWICSLNWLAKAHCYNVRSENIWVAYREIYFPHSRFVGFERETQLTRSIAAEHYYRLHGEWVASRNLFRFLYYGIWAEEVRAHISELFSRDGIVEGFLGSRQRVYLKAKNVGIEGTELTGLFYVADGVVGAGGHWMTKFDQGHVFAYADWHRPFWEIMETLVHFGSENRIGIGGRYVYNARLDGLIDIGLRDYGIKDNRRATRTIKIGGSANLFLTLKNPLISLNYILDAEYVYHEDEKRNPFGAIFQPVPLDSRENHTIRLVIRNIWRRWWAWGAFVGETFNRLGTHDLTMGVNFHYYFPCGLEFDFLMERYPSTTNLGKRVDDIKAGVKWRY